MEPSRIDAIVGDFAAIPGHEEDEELRLLEAAIFVEESFGLVLSDDDIAPRNLGSSDAIRRFVASRAGA